MRVFARASVAWLATFGLLLHQGGVHAANPVTGTVDLWDVEREVDWSIAGTNVLFTNHLDGKRAGLPAVLKKMDMMNLRYPGGELADNYDFRTNSVENVDVFPNEKAGDRAARMDFDEFMTEVVPALSSNVRLTIVLNLEGAFSQWDGKNHGVQQRWKYRRLAVDWMKKVLADYPGMMNKIYWQIGNESYHKGTRYSLSAQQYGEAVAYFATEMKKVYSNVKIVAIGPWKKSTKSFVDTLGPDGATKYNEYYHDESRFSNEKEARDHLSSLSDSEARAEICGEQCGESGGRWWDVVLPLVGDNIAAVSPHRYSSRFKNGRADFMDRELTEFGEVKAIHDMAKQQAGSDVRLALTEFNVGSQNSKELTRIEQCIAFVELHLGYVAAGADILNVWPLTQKANLKATHVVDTESYNELPIVRYFELFRVWKYRLLAKLDLGNQLAVSGIAFLHISRGTTWIYLVNKDTESTTVTLNGMPTSSVLKNIWVVYPDASDSSGMRRRRRTDLGSMNGNKLTLDMPGYSVFRVQVNFPNQPRKLMQNVTIGFDGDDIDVAELDEGSDDKYWLAS